MAGAFHALGLPGAQMPVRDLPNGAIPRRSGGPADVLPATPVL